MKKSSEGNNGTACSLVPEISYCHDGSSLLLTIKIPSTIEVDEFNAQVPPSHGNHHHRKLSNAPGGSRRSKSSLSGKNPWNASTSTKSCSSGCGKKQCKIGTGAHRSSKKKHNRSSGQEGGPGGGVDTEVEANTNFLCSLLSQAAQEERNRNCKNTSAGPSASQPFTNNEQLAQFNPQEPLPYLPFSVGNNQGNSSGHSHVPHQTYEVEYLPPPTAIPEGYSRQTDYSPFSDTPKSAFVDPKSLGGRNEELSPVSPNNVDSSQPNQVTKIEYIPPSSKGWEVSPQELTFETDPNNDQPSIGVSPQQGSPSHEIHASTKAEIIDSSLVPPAGIQKQARYSEPETFDPNPVEPKQQGSNRNSGGNETVVPLDVQQAAEVCDQTASTLASNQFVLECTPAPERLVCCKILKESCPSEFSIHSIEFQVESGQQDLKAPFSSSVQQQCYDRDDVAAKIQTQSRKSVGENNDSKVAGIHRPQNKVKNDHENTFPSQSSGENRNEVLKNTGALPNVQSFTHIQQISILSIFESKTEAVPPSAEEAINSSELKDNPRSNSTEVQSSSRSNSLEDRSSPQFNSSEVEPKPRTNSSEIQSYPRANSSELKDTPELNSSDVQSNSQSNSLEGQSNLPSNSSEVESKPRTNSSEVQSYPRANSSELKDTPEPNSSDVQSNSRANSSSNSSEAQSHSRSNSSDAQSNLQANMPENQFHSEPDAIPTSNPQMPADSLENNSASQPQGPNKNLTLEVVNPESQGEYSQFESQETRGVERTELETNGDSETYSSEVKILNDSNNPQTASTHPNVEVVDVERTAVPEAEGITTGPIKISPLAKGIVTMQKARHNAQMQDTNDQSNTEEVDAEDSVPVPESEGMAGPVKISPIAKGIVTMQKAKHNVQMYDADDQSNTEEVDAEDSVPVPESEGMAGPVKISPIAKGIVTMQKAKHNIQMQDNNEELGLDKSKLTSNPHECVCPENGSSTTCNCDADKEECRCPSPCPCIVETGKITECICQICDCVLEKSMECPTKDCDNDQQSNVFQYKDEDEEDYICDADDEDSGDNEPKENKYGRQQRQEDECNDGEGREVPSYWECEVQQIDECTNTEVWYRRVPVKNARTASDATQTDPQPHSNKKSNCPSSVPLSDNCGLPPFPVCTHRPYRPIPYVPPSHIELARARGCDSGRFITRVSAPTITNLEFCPRPTPGKLLLPRSNQCKK